MLLSSRIGTLALALWCSLAGSAAAFTNPLIPEGDNGDPQLVHVGGTYYLLTTTFTDIRLRSASSIGDLAIAQPKVIYRENPVNADRASNIWAPEIHWDEANNRWICYYSAGVSRSFGSQHVHALESHGGPGGPYTYVGQVTPRDVWAIDATILRTEEYGLFLLTSCCMNGSPQSLCIQPMKDLLTPAGGLSIISSPSASWETHEKPVEEGPAALYANGHTYVSFSASACWGPNYALGLLRWDGKTNPTSRNAWTKSGPVLKQANGLRGVGHNSFFTNGSETWIAYHGTSQPNGNCDHQRSVTVQKMGFGPQGPIFPVPQNGQVQKWEREDERLGGMLRYVSNVL